MILPFGKHIGKDIKDVPDKYLYWLYYHNKEKPFDDFQVSEVVVLAAEEELKRRSKEKKK